MAVPVHVVLVIGCLLAMPEVTQCEEQVADSGAVARERVKALRAAFDEWRSAVRFHATFRYEEGLSRSLEDALAGRMDPELSAGRPQVQCTGVFTQRGKLRRYRLSYGHAPILVDGAPPPGVAPVQQIVTHVSYDESTNGVVDVLYYFPHRDKDAGRDARRPNTNLNQLMLELRRGKRHADSFAAGSNSSGALHPLAPVGNGVNHPLECWDFGQAEEPAPRDGLRTRGVDAEHVEIVLTRIGRYHQERRIVFWTAVSPPVIVEAVNTVKLPDESVHVYHAKLSDFVRCPGGMVARRVNFAAKGIHAGGFVVAREWVSEDLGAREPRMSDFRVCVDAGTTLVGVARPPAVRDGRRCFDISELKETDVGDPPPLGPQKPADEVAAATAPEI